MMREQIIDAGVRQLREFGYPGCTAENILTDYVYRAFFKKMVEGTRDDSPRSSAVHAACDGLLRDISKADKGDPAEGRG